MRQRIGCALGVALAVLVTYPARAQQSPPLGSERAASSVPPAPPAVPAADTTRSDTTVHGPRLPPVVLPAEMQLRRDDAPAAVAQDKIVIPVTTAVIVLAVVVLILLID